MEEVKVFHDLGPTDSVLETVLTLHLGVVVKVDLVYFVLNLTPRVQWAELEEHVWI